MAGIPEVHKYYKKQNNVPRQMARLCLQLFLRFAVGKIIVNQYKPVHDFFTGANQL